MIHRQRLSIPEHLILSTSRRVQAHLDRGHQLQGERAGIIDVDFDMECMQSVIDNPEWLASKTTTEIMEKAGTEGVEIIMWLVMRGALDENVNLVHKHYHLPVSNTAAGVLVLENPLTTY